MTQSRNVNEPFEGDTVAKKSNLDREERSADQRSFQEEEQMKEEDEPEFETEKITTSAHDQPEQLSYDNVASESFAAPKSVSQTQHEQMKDSVEDDGAVEHFGEAELPQEDAGKT